WHSRAESLPSGKTKTPEKPGIVVVYAGINSRRYHADHPAAAPVARWHWPIKTRLIRRYESPAPAPPVSRRGQTTTATQKRSSAPGWSASSAAPAARPGAGHKVTNHSGGRASLHMRVAATLQQGHATVTLAFPGIRRIEFAPGGKELVLLTADGQTVLIAHIKIDTRYIAATIIFRLGATQFEVHFKI